MARPRGGGKGRTKPITMRLPPDEEAFYRSKANQHGMSLSAYLTKTLVEGVIAANVAEVEARLQAIVASIPDSVRTGIPDDIALSIITSETLLTAIVEAQNIQVLYRSQDAAKARMKKRKEAE